MDTGTPRSGPVFASFPLIAETIYISSGINHLFDCTRTHSLELWDKVISGDLDNRKKSAVISCHGDMQMHQPAASGEFGRARCTDPINVRVDAAPSQDPGDLLYRCVL